LSVQPEQECFDVVAALLRRQLKRVELTSDIQGFNKASSLLTGIREAVREHVQNVMRSLKLAVRPPLAEGQEAANTINDFLDGENLRFCLPRTKVPALLAYTSYGNASPAAFVLRAKINDKLKKIYLRLDTSKQHVDLSKIQLMIIPADHLRKSRNRR